VSARAESRVVPRRLVIAPFEEELAGISAVLAKVYPRETVPGLRWRPAPTKRPGETSTPTSSTRSFGPIFIR